MGVSFEVFEALRRRGKSGNRRIFARKGSGSAIVACLLGALRERERERTPPNWDGDLDSTVGRSFITRPILSLSQFRSSADTPDERTGSLRHASTARDPRYIDPSALSEGRVPGE